MSINLDRAKTFVMMEAVAVLNHGGPVSVHLIQALWARAHYDIHSELVRKDALGRVLVENKYMTKSPLPELSHAEYLAIAHSALEMVTHNLQEETDTGTRS